MLCSSFIIHLKRFHNPNSQVFPVRFIEFGKGKCRPPNFANHAFVFPPFQMTSRFFNPTSVAQDLRPNGQKLAHLLPEIL